MHVAALPDGRVGPHCLMTKGSELRFAKLCRPPLRIVSEPQSMRSSLPSRIFVLSLITN